MIDLCRWEAGENTVERAKKKILEAQRERLNLPIDTPLNEVPPPKVADIFAGGGAIPLEALRLGCEAYAIELNPVAHIVELCTLVYPQKHGKKLADEVEKWGDWVIENVRAEIGDLYPAIKIGKVLPQEFKQIELLPKSKTKQLSLAKTLTPVAYLWTRIVKCPNPSCGASVPLVRQTWLCKKSKKYVALKVIPNYETKQVEFEVVDSTIEKGLGFDPASGSSRGNSICRHCGTTIPSKPYIQEQGKAGKIGHQLMAIACTTSCTSGKTYFSGKTFEQYVPDEAVIKNRLEKLVEEIGISTPNEPVKVWSGVFNAPLYGLDKFEKLFTTRQLLALMTFVKWVKLAHEEMMQQGYEKEFGKAIITYLGLLLSKISDINNSLCAYEPVAQCARHFFGRQAIPMVWDFGENVPTGKSSGSWKEHLTRVLDSINITLLNKFANTQRGSAMSLPFQSETLDAVITDPPYFNSVPYADLSDFFYVWLKRSIGHLYPEHFSSQLTPKKNEAIMEPSRHEGNKTKAAKAYKDMMHKSFCEASAEIRRGDGCCICSQNYIGLGYSN